MESHEPRSKTIPILVVDDQMGHITSVQGFLAPYDQYQVDGVQTLELARSTLSEKTYDTVLLDLAFGPYERDPHFNASLGLLRDVRTEIPRITVLLYSTIALVKPLSIQEALRCGVSYLIKEQISFGDALHRAIDISRSGGVVYSEAVVPFLAELMSEHKATLTDRELEIARLVNEEMTNAQIAAKLGISTARVRDVVSSIMPKIGASNRAGIAVWVERNQPNSSS